MKRFVLLIALSTSFYYCFAQDTTQSAPVPYYRYPQPFPEERSLLLDSSGFFNPKLFQPTLGLGTGVLSFYGDVRSKKMFSPSISRLGYNVSVAEYLTRYLSISARVLFGTVGASETGPRFANFESKIRAGGINLSYNFDNFLPVKRRIDPFITSGFEYFEYLTKTDLMDKSGNQYHFWSDGSLKNLDESDPNAINAVSLTRDYVYETDVRKWNNAFFGKYPERSFAVPVGIGVNFHLATRWNFKLGTTMHFSFTDYIDGVTEKNKGKGEGNTKKDHFLETYFTLTFDLFNPKPPFVSPLTDEELLALENEDSDGDGVTDFKDSCQGTPTGVTVNMKGCPPDSDEDGKPDYADKEINSPLGAFVDDNGVAMDDSTIARNWREWSDTANLYVAYTQVVNPPAVAGDGWSGKRTETIVYRRELTILLGAYKAGVPPEEMGKLLSVPDVRSSLQSDSTTAYTAGTFNTKSDAEKRQSELIASGFPNAKIMMKNKDGSLSEPSANILAGLKDDGKSLSSSNNPPVNMSGVVYRVQLGAYSKKLSSSVFKTAGQLIELKTEDGLYKYMSGSYTSIQDALKQRDELIKKGYGGAFVVAYKDSKRVALSSVSGGIMQKPENLEDPKKPTSVVDKKLISFRVQLGAFVNDPPSDIMEKLKQVPGLETRKKSNGVTQYIAGKFTSYKEAEKFKEDVVKKYGIPDAFMIAFFKQDMIPVQEALELLK